MQSPFRLLFFLLFLLHRLQAKDFINTHMIMIFWGGMLEIATKNLPLYTILSKSAYVNSKNFFIVYPDAS